MADRDILRALASRLRRLRIYPSWRTPPAVPGAERLNPIRPVVLLDELPWNQLNHAHELDLYCEDSYLRAVELAFRRTLYQWAHCPGDMLVKPFFALHRSVHIGSIGVTVEEDTLAADQGNHIVAHRYHDQLPDWEALEKLHVPEIVVDQALDDARRERLEDIRRHPAHSHDRRHACRLLCPGTTCPCGAAPNPDGGPGGQAEFATP